jgi:hypothetical protein
MVSLQREFLTRFVSGTVFGFLWPERMARDRRLRQSPKGIVAVALIHALAPYYVAYVKHNHERAIAMHRARVE